MERRALLSLFLWLLATSAVLFSLGCGGGSASSATSGSGGNGGGGSGGGGGGTQPPAGDKIKHVVIIFQENRTPDNLFHDPNLIAAGADIASSGFNTAGQEVPLAQIPLGIQYDPQHGHYDFELMYDGGKMDGAGLIPSKCNTPAPGCAPPNPSFAYVQASDAQPYFQMAEQ